MEFVSKSVVVTLNSTIRDRKRQNAEWREDLDSMPKRWTAILKTNLERFPHDITFSVKAKMISCHKFVLSVASPFFEDLIIQAEKTGQKVIKVNGMDPTVFNNLLRHVYLDENLVIADKDLVSTMSAAYLCELPGLVNLCCKRLQTTLSTKNAVTIFQGADRINNVQLRRRAYLYILINFYKILDSDDFLRFTEDQLCEFLKSDDLNAPTETGVFRAVVRWGEHQCNLQRKDKTNGNLRKIFAKVFCHIRMSSITLKAFMSIIKPSNLFYPEDNAKLFRYFWGREENKDTKSLLKELNLSDSVRRCQISDGTVNLFSDFNLQQGYDAKEFEGFKFTRFKIDGDEKDPPIYLKGIGFAGIPSVPAERIIMRIQVYPAIFCLPNPATIYEGEFYTYIAKAKKIMMIDLNESIKIFPNKEYTVHVLPIYGTVASWKGRISDIVFYNKMGNLARPINLKVTNSFNHIYSLKFSPFK